jgi:hypothetical protein
MCNTVLKIALFSDFKKNYVLPGPIETVDFYQLICFLLQIPPEEHDGDWKRIEGMLTVSRAIPMGASAALLAAANVLIVLMPAMFIE